MTANDDTPDDGEKTAEQSDDETADFEEVGRELLAERLRSHGHRVSADLLGLAADVESGEAVEGVGTVRENLERADTTVRRHLGTGGFATVDVELDPTERDLSTFGEVEGDVESWREEASREDLALALTDDVHEVRAVADRVDTALLNDHTDLTDAEVERLWDAAATVQAWARDVLVHRTDRDVLTDREDAENGESGEEAGDRA